MDRKRTAKSLADSRKGKQLTIAQMLKRPKKSQMATQRMEQSLVRKLRRTMMKWMMLCWILLTQSLARRTCEAFCSIKGE